MQLSDQSLKILGLLQTKRKEYMDGIAYAQSTLKDNSRVAALLPIAETFAALEKRVKEGHQVTREELAGVKGLNGEILFGYSEKERIRSK